MQAGNAALQKVPLVGIIKEVAPTVQAKDDETLGVGEFQRDYFASGTCYLDETRAFVGALGDRTLNPLKGLGNPLKAWQAFKDLGERLKEKKIEGNMVGEGLVLGGVLVFTGGPEPQCIYQYEEETGMQVPLQELGEAIAKLA